MHLRGFTEDYEASRYGPELKTNRANGGKSDSRTRGAIEGRYGRRLMRLRRLRLADGIPMALELSHIPLKQFPGLEKITSPSSPLLRASRNIWCPCGLG